MRSADDIAKGPTTRLLSCPHCHAEFGFEEWAKAATCPTCGRRVSFFEANGRSAARSAAPAPAETAFSPAPSTSAGNGAWDPLPDTVPAVNVVTADRPAPCTGAANGAGDPSAANGAGQDGRQGTASDGWTWSGPEGVPVALPVALPVAQPPSAAASRPASIPVASPSSRGHVYTIGGKALEWSPAWTVVLVIWAIVAVGLVATRVDMGRLTVMTPGETAAIAAVKQIKLPSGAPTETVLRYSATHDLNLEGHIVQIKPKAAQMWYAFDRSWEHRTYVYYELPGTSLIGSNVVLSWSVTNGVATADGVTRLALAKAAQTMAHPPSPNSIRAVPGIIPSLPPDLQ
jgi:hypothetical protein